MDEKVIEELKAVLAKHGPNFLSDGDGGIIHHDIKTNRIHMVEIRVFDVTEVPHAARAGLTAVPFCDECSGPFVDQKWLMEGYGGHWDTCPNRVRSAA